MTKIFSEKKEDRCWKTSILFFQFVNLKLFCLLVEARIELAPFRNRRHYAK